jgi:Protein of unknown function (DUF3151)
MTATSGADPSAAQPVHLTPTGPPETILDPEPPEALAALVAALGQPADERRAAVSEVVARWPRFLDGWARLGESARDPIEAYAYFRVGYHRGLDRLRASGWRGSGYVPWVHVPNRGFLRALDGLRTTAAAIGETDEERRCAEFLFQCDPEWARAAETSGAGVQGQPE